MSSHDDDPFEPTVSATTGSATGGSPGASDRSGADVTATRLPGYTLGELLGKGGMGEVVLAHDPRIGREVAIKRIRSDAPTPQLVQRFLREARIQARLDHPSIVPVHELGTDDAGRPYFTMKRLAGTTLAELLAAPNQLPRQRLLRYFAEVCLAVEFAHTRGYIHRDLKPANIMIGGFGEVYVLDWGVARRIDDAGAAEPDPELDSLDGATRLGAIIGTPGYMAPEQVLGAPTLGAAADVYALGAILFEILAGEPLHPRGHAALAATLEHATHMPAARRPDRDVPPELDAICRDALAFTAADRPTSGQLAARIEKYLDGDRDLEGRRALAVEQVALAREALASDDPARRAAAMKAAGRALGLDPESREAAELVTKLLIEPPAVPPAELGAELEASAIATQRRQARAAAFAFSALLAFLLAVSARGLVASWTMVGLVSLTVAMGGFAWYLSRRGARTLELFGVAIGNCLLLAGMSRVFGSLIVVPGLGCVMAVSLSSYPQLVSRQRLVLGLLSTAWCIPVILESLHVLAPTWTVHRDAIAVMSTVVRIAPGYTTALLIGSQVATIVVIGLFANALARSRAEARRELEIQAWHLRQLIPTHA